MLRVLFKGPIRRHGPGMDHQSLFAIFAGMSFQRQWSYLNVSHC